MTAMYSSRFPMFLLISGMICSGEQWKQTVLDDINAAFFHVLFFINYEGDFGLDVVQLVLVPGRCSPARDRELERHQAEDPD